MMKIKRTFSLYHLLLVLCALMLVLIGYKGYGISQKMASFDEAERLYQEKDLIQAETWYLKARNNRSISYKEEQISSRLAELAPITEMKQQLKELNSEGAKATAKGDFDKLMDVYTRLAQFRNTYYTPNGAYSEYYKEISQSYGVSENLISYFAQFKERFYAEKESNLEDRNYEDESFKWNLLRIPANFFGDSTKQIQELSREFEDYDTRRITYTASTGQFDTLYNDVKDMVAAYQSHQFEAPWILSTTEEIIGNLLKQELEGRSYAAFALHAKQYMSFAEQSSPGSTLTNYVERQITKLMKQAKSLTARGNYEEAIQLYTDLAGYQDTTDAVKQVKLAWMAADPVQLLPVRSEGGSYQHVTGGTKAFGSQIYVAAADETNRIYFGRMNETDQVQVLSNTEITSGTTIRSLSIDRDLSSTARPIIRIEAESVSRKALYALFEVLEDRIELILWVEADDLEVNPDGSLLIENPVGSGEGETAIYERSGFYYEFVGIKTRIPEIPEIPFGEITQYPLEKVRFSCTITAPGESETIAIAGNSYMVLTGNFNFSEGPAIITGTFVQYRDIEIDAELLTVPVIQVESFEPTP